MNRTQFAYWIVGLINGVGLGLALAHWIRHAMSKGMRMAHGGPIPPPHPWPHPLCDPPVDPLELAKLRLRVHLENECGADCEFSRALSRLKLVSDELRVMGVDYSADLIVKRLRTWIPDDTERKALAFKLFGRVGAQLLAEAKS
jgi:hypothetical protein